LLFRIRPFGKDPGGVQLGESEGIRRSEFLERVGQIKIQEEERVIREVPELGSLGAVAPEKLRTGDQSIFEHFDSRPELPPKDVSSCEEHFKTAGGRRISRFQAVQKPARSKLIRGSRSTEPSNATVVGLRK